MACVHLKFHEKLVPIDSIAKCLWGRLLKTLVYMETFVNDLEKWY